MSPMMKRYLETKEKYKDCILFYRLGDFYEMFFDDALKASKILDIVLTGRDCGENERAPMCGIPYHACDAYVAKLIAAGEKVAICEQLSEPNKKGLVDRDVVRIITSGTVMDSSMLDEKQNNYIAALFHEKKGTGLAWCDISTGEFYFAEAQSVQSLSGHLARINPKEIICNKTALDIKLPEQLKGNLPNLSPYYEWTFGLTTAENKLKKQFAVNNLGAFGAAQKDLAISAAGALMEYLTETQKRTLGQINKMQEVSDDRFLKLDIQTRRNLELTENNRDKKRFGSLLWLIDNTVTSMGARQISSWVNEPLSKADDINYRLDSVEELCNGYLLQEALQEHLAKIKDIERLAARISYGTITPRECEMLCFSLNHLPKLKQLLSGAKTPLLADAKNAIPDLAFVSRLLFNAISDNAPSVTKDGGYIKAGYNAELDTLRNLGANGKNLVTELLKKEKEATGIKNMKVGFNKVFGYYYEIPRAAENVVPLHFVRKQTVSNSERYVTEELKTIEEKILTAEEKSLMLEKQLFDVLRDTLSKYVPQIQKAAKAVAAVDCILSLSVLAARNNYVRPTVSRTLKHIKIKGGRHPIVENILKSEFIPNDTYLNTEDSRAIILTGPNMAGKSTYMRQVALITLLAHLGSFVPASEAEICLCDQIFTRIGASDDLLYNQSTFMVEMTETANILHNATENSLIILDELGRGTSTYDGLSVAWAVLEYLAKEVKAKVMFATHYHELTELERVQSGIKNFHSTVKETENGIVFLHKIKEGAENKSFGIEVAGLAGLPKSVVTRAKQIMEEKYNG